MSVPLSRAQKYLSSKAIFAGQVVSDFINYKGNPYYDYFYIPNSTNSSGYCVISKNYNKMLSIGDKVSEISYQAAPLIATANYNTNDNYFSEDLIVLNYVTKPLMQFVGSSSSGYAYRLRKSTISHGDKFKPGIILEKIGSYSDIRNKYQSSVVLTRIQAFVDDGSDSRPLYGVIDGDSPGFEIYSVSSCLGRSYYNSDGQYDPNNPYSQSAYGGYMLVGQIGIITSTTYGSWRGRDTSYVWIDLLNKMGADVVVFDTNSTDKTGWNFDSNYCTVAVIFNTPDDLKKLGNSVAAPFVVNNEDLAKTGDIKNFPLYVPAGVPDNETGGGEGNGDNDSDKVDEPKNPDLSPISAGNNLYAMTQTELEQTFNFLWDGHNKDILGVTVSEANIIDTLCNCFYMPFDILSHDSAHCVEATVTAGGYASEVNSKAIISGYNKRFNFGDLEISEYYGSYLDYAPFTTVSIYLPYIGIKPLDVSKVMGKTINVTYAVDFSQGIVTAYISYYYDGNKQVFAEFSGQMGIPVKITGKNTTAAENAVKDAAFAVGGFALAAISVLAAPATGGASLIGTAGAVGAGINAIGKTINATTLQPDSVSVGNAGAENWLLSPQGCYVFIQRPRTATPENFKDTNGWATRYTGTISEFTGYLECSTVINTVSATAEEKNQITNLLKQGVYI